MATATQLLHTESSNNPIKTSKSDTKIPRIDLAKLDNIPYYIESMFVSFLLTSIFIYSVFFVDILRMTFGFFSRGVYSTAR